VSEICFFLFFFLSGTVATAQCDFVVYQRFFLANCRRKTLKRQRAAQMRAAAAAGVTTHAATTSPATSISARRGSSSDDEYSAVSRAKVIYIIARYAMI
jgi:hypothetical protein